jgi:hypothetical protein
MSLLERVDISYACRNEHNHYTLSSLPQSDVVKLKTSKRYIWTDHPWLYSNEF